MLAAVIIASMGARKGDFMHVPVLGRAHARRVELGSAQSDVNLLSLCVRESEY